MIASPYRAGEFLGNTKVGFLGSSDTLGGLGQAGRVVRRETPAACAHPVAELTEHVVGQSCRVLRPRRRPTPLERIKNATSGAAVQETPCWPGEQPVGLSKRNTSLGLSTSPTSWQLG